jgi:hypothetical protein
MANKNIAMHAALDPELNQIFFVIEGINRRWSTLREPSLKASDGNGAARRRRDRADLAAPRVVPRTARRFQSGRTRTGL